MLLTEFDVDSITPLIIWCLVYCQTIFIHLFDIIICDLLIVDSMMWESGRADRTWCRVECLHNSSFWNASEILILIWFFCIIFIISWCIPSAVMNNLSIMSGHMKHCSWLSIRVLSICFVFNCFEIQIYSYC